MAKNAGDLAAKRRRFIADACLEALESRGTLIMPPLSAFARYTSNPHFRSWKNILRDTLGDLNKCGGVNTRWLDPELGFETFVLEHERHSITIECMTKGRQPSIPLDAPSALPKLGDPPTRGCIIVPVAHPAEGRNDASP